MHRSIDTLLRFRIRTRSPATSLLPVTYCPRCRRDDLRPGAELALVAFLLAALLAVAAYHQGFAAGTKSVAASIDTYTQ